MGSGVGRWKLRMRVMMSRSGWEVQMLSEENGRHVNMVNVREKVKERRAEEH